MFTVHDTTTAIALCVLTMIGWGSWANTQKLAGNRHWPFELFYWDYAIGVALMGLLFAFTLGNYGSAGEPMLANLKHAGLRAEGIALASGAVFNVSNILLVAAIDVLGLALAFPVGVGLALVLGTAVSYLQAPKGNLLLIVLGVTFIVLAMIVSTLAYRRVPRSNVSRTRNSLYFGLYCAIAAGLLMGFFYPQLTGTISPRFNDAPISAGLLTPYTALLFFGIGVLLSNIPLNAWFMRSRGSHFASYTAAGFGLHVPGILGGMIWMLALSLNIIASGVAGPAASYALGQGATLIAALWGIFVWKEFRGARAGTTPYLAAMLIAYALGIVLIGKAVL